MNWHSLTVEDVIKNVKTDKINGLAQNEAKQRLNTGGKNQLQTVKNKSIVKKFFEQLCDFMSLLLIGAALISFLTSYHEDSGGLTDCVIILAIVLLNAVIGVFQESRAQKAIDALKQLSAPKATVIRNGQVKSIPSSELVVGDIIKLSSGDCVPADARLIRSSNLKTEESALTGESLPVDKNADVTCHPECVLSDRVNMVFSTSIVCLGNATAVVTDTGMDTQVGKIADLLSREDAPKTPLQVRLGGVSKALGLIAISICGIIFGLGIYRGSPILDSFILAVSLAVAAIPEGLPAIVTVVLSIGVQRLAKKNAIIRRLPAVESLGGATVICSDKTGTLTQNKMTVCAVSSHDGFHEFKSPRAANILKLCVLCSNSVLNIKKNRADVSGEPTENALVMAGFDCGMIKPDLEKTYKRVREIPFDSNRKLMTTIHKSDNGYLVITKGAPEKVLPLCTDVLAKNHTVKLSHTIRNLITEHNNDMASNAMRVIAVAYKYTNAVPNPNIENGLVFAGLIGMIDPVRKGVKESVRTCKEAGITPVMITGDHVITAKAIASELGIISSGEDIVMTGSQLDTISQESLTERIERCRVFARVTPEHKVRIVKAFREKGNIVAMTGDGVNDAPALKAADIGCAMGKSGTDVAKSASDMILTDDNFSTIINAVEQGRGIYDNIKKAIHFLLSCNIGEILVIFVSQLLNLQNPLVPIQLLWINLITDSLPAMSLGVEKVEDDIMKRRPVDPKHGIFSNGMGIDIALEGIMIGGLTLLGFIIGLQFYSIDVGRTMAFAVLSISELVHAFNVRSDYSLFKIGFFTNRKLVISFIVCLLLQLAVIVIAPLASVFKTVALNVDQWLITAGLSILPLIIVELSKLVTKKDR